MSRTFIALLATFLVAGLFCATLGANDVLEEEQEQPHPMFSDLEMGQMVNIQWDQTGCVISNWGGFKKVVALGPDYIVVTETGQKYFIYINQIKYVQIRPPLGAR